MKKSKSVGKGLIGSGGDKYGYLGHFRSPKVQHEGHNQGAPKPLVAGPVRATSGAGAVRPVGGVSGAGVGMARPAAGMAGLPSGSVGGPSTQTAGPAPRGMPKLPSPTKAKTAGKMTTETPGFRVGGKGKKGKVKPVTEKGGYKTPRRSAY